MKTHVKKKKFQAFCREQAAKGLINDINGSWIPIRIGPGVGNMHRDYKAGYKLGR
jgi:hypothetical protein